MSNCCTMCGAVIPDDQGSSTCSMCFGDVGHGKDGYYEEYERQQFEQWEREQQERERGDE